MKGERGVLSMARWWKGVGAVPMGTSSNTRKAVILLALSVAVAGCAGAGYKVALQKVGDIGPRIAGDIRPTDAGGEARKQAFLDLVEECRSLGAK